MTLSEKIAILNSLEIVDHDCSGGECLAIWVDLNTPVLEAMKKVGMDDNAILDYVKRWIDIVDSVPYLDITEFAFQICGAEWFTGTEFLDERPEKP